MLITSTNGHEIVVDEELAEWATREKWFAKRVESRLYAASTKSGRYMHRLIMRAPNGTIVDHKNGNGLDNRRANLKFRRAAIQGLAVRQPRGGKGKSEV